MNDSWIMAFLFQITLKKTYPPKLLKSSSPILEWLIRWFGESFNPNNVQGKTNTQEKVVLIVMIFSSNL